MCDAETKESRWNSLEVAKLVVSLATPILVIAVGYWLNMSLKDLEANFARERTVIEQRAELWKKMAEPLNDIYSYNVYVGNWQSITPAQVLEHKRNLDKIAYSYRPFFSKEFFKAYQSYTDAAFTTGRGWNLDAGINALQAHRSATAERSDLVLDVDARTEVHQKYYDLLEVVARELRLTIARPDPVLKVLD